MGNIQRWCGCGSYKNDNKLDSFDDWKREDDIQEAFGKCLINSGHKCVMYFQTFPRQVDWCGQQVCSWRQTG